MAHLYRHKIHGWRVEYTLKYPDASSRLKTKYAKDEAKAKEILSDAVKLEETLASRTLTALELIVYQEKKFIDRGDAVKLFSDTGISEDDIEIVRILQRISSKDKEAILSILRSLSR